MSDPAERQESVGRHYDEVLFEVERERLSNRLLVEYAITARYLERFIPSGAVVSDIGVGVGHYAELLARRGCRLHLVDVSGRLLDATVARLREAGHGAAVLDAVRASATSIGHIPTDECDAVLMLGPLYHLWTLDERRQAVGEAARILKAGGLLFAAGINHLSALRDNFARRPDTGREQYQARLARLKSGRLDPADGSSLSYAHLTTISEFRDLFSSDFEEAALVGVESFASPYQEVLAQLSSEDAEAWLDLIERTGATIEGLGQSDHFLYIGKRRS